MFGYVQCVSVRAYLRLVSSVYLCFVVGVPVTDPLLPPRWNWDLAADAANAAAFPATMSRSGVS